VLEVAVTGTGGLRCGGGELRIGPCEPSLEPCAQARRDRGQRGDVGPYSLDLVRRAAPAGPRQVEPMQGRGDACAARHGIRERRATVPVPPRRRASGWSRSACSRRAAAVEACTRAVTVTAAQAPVVAS